MASGTRLSAKENKSCIWASSFVTSDRWHRRARAISAAPPKSRPEFSLALPISLSPPFQGSVMPCASRLPSDDARRATYKLRGWPPRPPPPRPQVACRRMLHHNIQSNRNALTLQFAITNVCSFKKKCICFAYSWTKDYFRENWRKILVSLIWLISFENYFHGLQFFSDQVALTMPNLFPLKLPTVKRSSTLDSQLTRGNEQDHQLHTRPSTLDSELTRGNEQDHQLRKIVTWNNNNN